MDVSQLPLAIDLGLGEPQDLAFFGMPAPNPQSLIAAQHGRRMPELEDEKASREQMSTHAVQHFGDRFVGGYIPDGVKEADSSAELLAAQGEGRHILVLKADAGPDVARLAARHG